MYKNIFANGLDEKTIEQFEMCCEFDFVEAGVLMPDAHLGYVAPIGSVFKTRGVVVPSWVGYDIGCGVVACKFSFSGLVGLVRENSLEIFNEGNLRVPMGKGKFGKHCDVSKEVLDEFKGLIEELDGKECDRGIFKFLKTQALAYLGSLGSGNHFIELGFEEGNLDDVWLIVHSGSRGVGHKVASFYMKKACGDEGEFERSCGIDVDSGLGREYLNVLEFCLEFALLNRLEIVYRVLGVLRDVLGLEDLGFELWTNKNHNHCVFEGEFYVHRKGATSANLNERGVIPANMKDGSFLVRGLGNEDFLNSSSHGAGRKLSRLQAKSLGDLGEFASLMEGVVANVDFERLDESPFAYKDIFEVMELQKGSVEVLKHIKPIINWKG